MDNFNLDEMMDLAEAYEGPTVDAIVEGPRGSHVADRRGKHLGA